MYLKDLFLLMFWFKWSLVKLEACVKNVIFNWQRFSAVMCIQNFIDFFFMQSVSSGLEMKIDR